MDSDEHSGNLPEPEPSSGWPTEPVQVFLPETVQVFWQ